MVRCVLSQLKPYPRDSSFLAVKKASASTFFKAKNVELLGLYPIHKLDKQAYTIGEVVLRPVLYRAKSSGDAIITV